MLHPIIRTHSTLVAVALAFVSAGAGATTEGDGTDAAAPCPTAPPSEAFGAVTWHGPAYALLPALPDDRLIGGHGGGGGGGRGFRESSGVYVGVDAGLAVMVGVENISATDSASFGVHAGYRTQFGLAFDVRGDDLGVSAPDGRGPLVAAGIGARYWIPLLVMPFFEAHVGADEYGGHVGLAGDLGAGVAFPIGDHFEIDVSARDWIGDVSGAVRHVPLFTLGFVVGFPNGR